MRMRTGIARTAAAALLHIGVLGLLLSAAPTTISAQTYQGGIRGAVRDPVGIVIHQAEVKLVNEATNAARTTHSNETGEYVFANVLPGTYTVQVSLPGFKTYEETGIRIGTQQFIVLDVKLEVGNLSEEVTISGRSPIIDTATASVSSSLDSKTLELLPSAGRNAFFLSVTTPTVIPSGDPQFVRQQDQTNSSLLSLGGGPRRANNYTLEGVSITDLRNRPTFIPSIEAVEEVKVQVSTYDAEMGRTGGGVFNTVGKSGSNRFHGSALMQNRPEWGKGKFYFARNLPKPDNYFWLYGGSFGGPIAQDRMFFWATTENYRTKTSRSAVLFLPTERELSGDFSQSGVTIYNPLTTRPDPANPGQFIRDPFPGNVIPPHMINPVAAEVARFFPRPTSGNSLPAVAELKDRANQATAKIDFRVSDKYTITGMYAWYNSEEPESRFYGKELGDNPADPAEGLLKRTVHVVTINNVLVPTDRTVYALRYGYTQFVDDDVPNGFDPASLGFSPAFTNLITYKKFPSLNISGYGSVNFDTFGDRDPQDTTYYSHNFNASATRWVGSHTLKAGAEYRLIGMKLFARGQPSGDFEFNSGFTRGPNPLVGGTTAHSLASFLLGYPASGSIVVGTPNDFYIHYYAGYAQDDYRVTPKLTVNFGLRYEFEQGLQERDNRMTVGFDRERAFPVQVPGLDLRGGLMYAGVDEYPTYQGDPSKTKFAPRGGFAYSINQKTVVRGGYGLFYAPNQYAFPNENRMGTRGFTAVTTYFPSNDGGLTPCASCTLTNPFPNGIEEPVGSNQGLLTGAGGTVHFVDQFRRSAYLHQYSMDLQREITPDISVSIGYLGSRSENLSVGGTNSNNVNINQLDPSYLSLGTALLEQVPNPFYRNAAFGAFSRQPTIARGQLLRPYPQFGDVLAHQVSAGRARYNSMILKFNKRVGNGWGANVNYTYSVNKDNLFGEVNYFSNNNNALARPLNNYDLDAEYARSLLDAPHRLNISVTYELPFGARKRWMSQSRVLNALFGGWAVTGVGTYQSGFPVVIVQDNNNSGLQFTVQRPNLTGTDPGTSGSAEDHYDPSCNCVNNWFNPAAWSAAAPFTLGNAPRTDTRQRTPFKKNWDIAVQKSQELAGKTIMVRAEIINAFADPNFLGPETRFGRAAFGRITQEGGFPRLLQVLVRVGW
ncbi:MAG TPA: TonB-dependent receptor [Vicinamibacterales bacterium]|nr:TonB-dependent receptor [Vicinamibacterales bacterium]